MNNPEETAYARDLGVNDFVCGWAEAYGSAQSEDSIKESMGTTEYFRSKGGKVAVTLECGQHLNEDAPDIGYQAALRAMAHCGLIEKDTVADITPEEKKNQRVVRMKDVIYRTEGAVMLKDFRHFDPVSKGDVIAHKADGSPLYEAPSDGYVVLPKKDTPAGQEWFYFGSAERF